MVLSYHIESELAEPAAGRDNCGEPTEVEMVQATVCYADGTRAEAVVLSIDRHSMRLAFRASDDSAELVLKDGQWRDEQGATIELEGLISDGEPFASVAGAGAAERLWQDGGL
jgi:hypothetical protein